VHGPFDWPLALKNLLGILPATSRDNPVICSIWKWRQQLPGFLVMTVQHTVVFLKTACTSGTAIRHEAVVEFFLSPQKQVEPERNGVLAQINAGSGRHRLM